MSKYLSIDTEATGLRDPNYLIQLAMVPVDAKGRKVYHELGRETLIRCPSFEELAPKLDAWNLEHNKNLIIDAHRDGIAPEALPAWIDAYFALPAVKEIF